MNNTLTTLLPLLLSRVLIALRGRSFMPKLVHSDFDTELANQGDTISIKKIGTKTATAVTPAQVPPAPASTTPSTVLLPMDQWYSSDFYITDKEVTQINAQADFIPVDLVESLECLVRKVNQDIFAEYTEVYEYVGTAGSNPFATNTDLVPDAMARLNANNCPLSSRFVVTNFAAEAAGLKLPALADASQAGDSRPKIEGSIGRKYGFDFFSDGDVPLHTAGSLGAAALATTGGTVEPIGETSIAVTSAGGTGVALLHGDILTIAGDTQTYVLTANVTIAGGGAGVLVIQPPLKVATAGGEAITLKASHRVNLAFNKFGFGFANRQLRNPFAEQLGGKVSYTISDPVSGIALRMTVAHGHMCVIWTIDILWGAVCMSPESCCRIAG